MSKQSRTVRFYIDLNLIRAGKAETVKLSDHTSGQLRVKAFAAKVHETENIRFEESHQHQDEPTRLADSADAFLSPVLITANDQASGDIKSRTRKRCSDKGFLEVSDQRTCSCWTEPRGNTWRESVASRRETSQASTDASSSNCCERYRPSRKCPVTSSSRSL